MVGHLITVGRTQGCRRVSLERGTTAGFAAARSLYARIGFEACGPFGAYVETPNSTFTTLDLHGGSSVR